jgi:LmbE family N-acetylglucosaminyl deacetylase
MLHLLLPKDRPLRLLCLGAHSDDIEIGCGGAVLKLLEERQDVQVRWVVFSSSSSPQRAEEAARSASLFLERAAGRQLVIKDFRDGYFPYIGAQIKEFFEGLKLDFSPDLIFTHHARDLHQDHRLLSELTWNTYRDHLILEYEIPKYDGDLGSPNVFVHLSEDLCRRKIGYLFDAFPSQHDNQWFTEDTFRSILRLRGIESNAKDRYAEAFYCRKLVLSP